MAVGVVVRGGPLPTGVKATLKSHYRLQLDLAESATAAQLEVFRSGQGEDSEPRSFIANIEPFDDVTAIDHVPGYPLQSLVAPNTHRYDPRPGPNHRQLLSWNQANSSVTSYHHEAL